MRIQGNGYRSACAALPVGLASRYIRPVQDRPSVSCVMGSRLSPLAGLVVAGRLLGDDIEAVVGVDEGDQAYQRS
jgi:hypothetical protein